MTEVSTRITDGNAEYEILSNGRTLSVTILRDTFKKMEHKSGCLEANFLNHWIDHSQVEDDENEISISTQLDNNESTIADFKSSVTGMQLDEFKDQMLPVLKAFLEFAYYIELGKQWDTPINPLNLIYIDNADGTGNIQAFYHSKSALNDFGADFLNEVIKMIMYLFVPEEINTAPAYPDVDLQDYFVQLDGDDGRGSTAAVAANTRLISQYGFKPVKDLADFVYNCQLNAEGKSITSVKDILHYLGDDDGIAQIEQDQGVVNDIQPNNLSNYASPEDVLATEESAKAAQEEQKQKNTLSPKQQRLAELEKQREAQKAAKEKKKEAKRQAKEDKRKQREEQLAQQKQAAQEKRQQAEKAKQQREAERQAQAAQAKQTANNDLDRAALDTKGKPKPQEEPDELVIENNKAPKKKINLLIPGIIVGTVLLVGGGIMIHNHNQKQAAQQAKTVATNQDPEKSPYFRKGSLDSGAQNWKDAAKQFDLFFASGAQGSTLNNNEVAAVFSAYLNTSQYQKILKNIGSPQTATALVNYLTAKKNLKTVNDLSSNQPIISLAKAVQNDDSEGIIENAPKCDVSNNGILQLDICKAYAKEKQLADGKKWAEEQKEPKKLINALKLYAQKNHIPNKTINEELG